MKLAQLWKEEKGQDLVEYGLLLVLIALLVIGTVQSVGQKVQTIFNSAATALESPLGGSGSSGGSN